MDNDIATSQQLGTLVDGCQSSCQEITLQKQCLDLSGYLVKMSMSSIPKDPISGSDAKTGYYVNLLADGTLVVGACQSNGELIEVKN